MPVIKREEKKDDKLQRKHVVVNSVPLSRI
jgi:hypothetical protein